MQLRLRKMSPMEQLTFKRSLKLLFELNRSTTAPRSQSKKNTVARVHLICRKHSEAVLPSGVPFSSLFCSYAAFQNSLTVNAICVETNLKLS